MDETQSPIAARLHAAGSAWPQHQSTLLRLPGEILEPIFEEVVRKYTVPGDALARQQRLDLDLLLTCRSVYLQAHALIYSVNPIVYDAVFSHLKDYADIFEINHVSSYWRTWQWSRVRELCFYATQHDLESDDVELLARGFSEFSCHRGSPRPVQRTASCSGVHSDQGHQQADEKGCIKEMPLSDTTTTLNITHLTIYLQKTCLYVGQDGMGLLGLDPELRCSGGRKESGLLDMRNCTRERLEETWQGYPEKSWGNSIGYFRELQRLHLVFEVAEAQRDSLDEIVSCATKWRFPLLPGGRGIFELAFDRIIQAVRVQDEMPSVALETFTERRVLQWVSVRKR